MVAEQRFRCSVEADRTWARLRSLWLLDDPQMHGQDWAERALINSELSGQDLGTDSRMLVWDAQSRLMILEARGPSQQAGVALARRRLASQRVTDVRERYGLDYDTAQELIEMVKEWIAWALAVDDGEPEPKMPWDEKERDVEVWNI